MLLKGICFEGHLDELFSNTGFYRLRVLEFVHFPLSVSRGGNETLDSS